MVLPVQFRLQPFGTQASLLAKIQHHLLLKQRKFALRKRFAPPAAGADAFFSLLGEATPPRSRLREPLAQGWSGDAAASAHESGVLGLLVKRYPGEPGLERFRRVDHGSCPTPVFYGPERLLAVETMFPIFT